MTRAPIGTAIVTGASRGIGAAIARQLGGAGIAVIVNYASDEEAAAVTVAVVTAAGGTAHAVQADVAHGKAFARLFDEAERLVGARGDDRVVEVKVRCWRGPRSRLRQDR